MERNCKPPLPDHDIHQHVRILAGPAHAGLDITNRCNLRCLHCYNRSGGDELWRDELTDTEIRQLFDQLLAVRPRAFCFCGGEPLLRLDLVLEGTRVLSSRGTGVSMVTNGLLLTPAVARRLKRAGMSLIQLSMDGASADTHDRLRRVPGSFAAVMDGIATARSAGLAVDIAFCPTAFNIDDITDAIRIADTLGIREFRVQPLMLLGRAVVNRRELDPTPDQYMQLVRNLKRAEHTTSVRIDWTDPVGHLVRLTEGEAESVPFVDIKSDGSLVASSYLPLVVGNLRRYPLQTYWEAGLQHVWMSPLVQKMARMIRSCRDFYRPDSPLPVVYYERHLIIDLIDDRLLDMTEQQADRLWVNHCMHSSAAGGTADDNSDAQIRG